VNVTLVGRLLGLLNWLVTVAVMTSLSPVLGVAFAAFTETLVLSALKLLLNVTVALPFAPVLTVAVTVTVSPSVVPGFTVSVVEH